MYEYKHKHKKLKYTDDNKLIVPSMEHLVEVQDFLQDLFEVVIATQDKELLAIYNKTALAYNNKANHTTFSNFKTTTEMATTKKAAAAQELAAAAQTKTVAAKKASAPSETIPVATEEKPKSQKETVIEYASAPHFLSIQEIADKFGFKKTNVSWYFSKHKLHQLKPTAAPEPAVVEPVAKKAKK